MSNFRFCIMGAGKIAHKFCDAVKQVPNCEISAIASKSRENAQNFAMQNQLSAWYGSYEEMLEKEMPDCVYIAVLPNAHYDLTMLCLRHHVPVLCEKAMFMDGAEAANAIRYAKEQGVFFMEALWSRFLPAIQQAKAWLESGRIGQPAFCDVVIGFLAPEGAENRFRCAALGGGAAHDILVYAYELTTYLFPDVPDEICATAVWGETGVDMTDHVMLRLGGTLASLTTSFAAPMDNHLRIYGTKGSILVTNPHFSDEAFLYEGSDVPTTHFRDTETLNGFVYEIQETIRCIQQGLLESPVVPHRDTLACARLFDQIERTKPAWFSAE